MLLACEDKNREIRERYWAGVIDQKMAEAGYSNCVEVSVNAIGWPHQLDSFVRGYANTINREAIDVTCIDWAYLIGARKYLFAR